MATSALRRVRLIRWLAVHNVMPPGRRAGAERGGARQLQEREGDESGALKHARTEAADGQRVVGLDREQCQAAGEEDSPRRPPAALTQSKDDGDCLGGCGTENR